RASAREHHRARRSARDDEHALAHAAPKRAEAGRVWADARGLARHELTVSRGGREPRTARRRARALLDLSSAREGGWCEDQGGGAARALVSTIPLQALEVRQVERGQPMSQDHPIAGYGFLLLVACAIGFGARAGIEHSRHMSIV